MESIIDKLHEIGLSGREAELYIALLQKKHLTAPEIAKITSVSRTKSYEILQNLVKKKVCNESFQNGIKIFSAVEPKIALENILSVHQDELNRKKKLADQFSESLMKLYTSAEDKDAPMDYIEVLTDPGQIRERWLTIQNCTSNELLVFTKPPYTKALNDNMEYESDVIKKKVVIKGIYESSSLRTSEEKNEFVSIVEDYEKVGEEARICPELPMKLVISDETISMFALNDRISLKPSITTMIVNHPSFAMAMKKVFESYWNTGYTTKQFKKLKLF